MEEETLLLLAKYHSEISQYTTLIIPDSKKIEFVRDKGNLMQFAETIGIPTPRTFYVPLRILLEEVGCTPPIQGREWISIIFSRFDTASGGHQTRISSGSFGILYVRQRKSLSPLSKRS
jgi:hypothetical protein